MPEFRYDPVRHRYTLDGVYLPSVSRILRNAGLMVPPATIPPDVLERARTRGQGVHSICEAIDRDEVVEIPDELGGYAEAYLQFRRDSRIEVVRTEQIRYHPTLLYAGTPDLECVLNGEMAIIDRKATYALPDDVDAQLAAYESMARAMDGCAGCNLFALHLKRNGTYVLQPYEQSVGWRKFWNALERWRLQHGQYANRDRGRA